MKILLTGATGFIGPHLVHRLKKEGHEDFVFLSRSPAKTKKLFPFPCQIYPWNTEQELPPKEALQGVDAVFHLVGEPVAEGRWTAQKKERIYQSRIKGTAHLMKVLNELPTPRVVISASAIGIYGNRGDETLTEQSALGGEEDFLAHVCRDWEKEILGAPGSHLRKVCIRTGIVLSPEGGALRKMLLPFQLGLGGPLGTGQQFMSWIHLDDLISVYLWALNNPLVSGPVNAVSPNPVTNKEFTKILAKTLHRPGLFPVPAVLLKLMLGEAATIALHSQRVLPEVLLKQEANFQFQHPKLAQALFHLLKA